VVGHFSRLSAKSDFRDLSNITGAESAPKPAKIGPKIGPQNPDFRPFSAPPPKVPKTPDVQLFGGPCTKADLDILDHQDTAWTILILDPPPPQKVQTGFTKEEPPGGLDLGRFWAKSGDLRRSAEKVGPPHETAKTAVSGVRRAI